MTMAMGRFLREFVGREARGVTPSPHQELKLLLSEMCAGWSVYGAASLDGQEAANFLRLGRILPGVLACRGRPTTRRRHF